MTKKRTTSKTVSNPLTESAFFQQEPAKKESILAGEVGQTEKQSASKKKPGRPKSSRPTARHSFEFYKDQLVALRRIRAKRELATGESVGLSQIVRELMDAYLQELGENIEK